jgi:hypothetical protein
LESSDGHASKRKRVTVDEVDLDTLTKEISKQCRAVFEEYFERKVKDTLMREVSKQCLAGIKEYVEQEGVEVSGKLRINTRMT